MTPAVGAEMKVLVEGVGDAIKEVRWEGGGAENDLFLDV